MGNACQQCLQMFQTQKNQTQKQPPLSSDRRINRKTEVQLYNSEQKTGIDDKKNGVCNSSLNSSMQDAKAFSRRDSVALGSNFGDKKSSFVSQSSIFDSSSIVIMNPHSKINKSNFKSEEYYSLIDNVYMIRKTADCLRVSTPSGISQLHCPPQYLTPTLFLAEGIPVQSILQIGNQKAIIQNNNSPIKITIRLSCLQCKKKVKLTYSKAYISIEKLKCPNCQKVSGWKLLDIDSNAAIWADGRKMDNHEQLQEAPSQIRLMGCVLCMRFSNLSKQLSCGCFICKNCEAANETDEFQCPICQSPDFLE